MKIQIVLAAIMVVFMGFTESKAVSKLQEKHNEAEVNERVEAALPKGKKHHYSDMRYESEEREGKHKRAAIKYNRWIERMNGKLIIPYAFDSSISSEKRAVIVSALDGLNSILSCHSPFELRDQQKHGNLHYLRFFSGQGCWSYVGQSFGSQGYQDISIGSGCQYKGTIQHEVLHALGFGHEQSRHDRDNYVTVNLANVISGYEGNFHKKAEGDVSEISKQSSYDYSSVMHYGESYFTSNGQKTIVPKDPTAVIGQRERLSPTDRIELNKYFQCDGYVYVTDPPTTTTTRAPVPRKLLRGTTFEKKYQDNEIHYFNWNQGGCIDEFKNCPDLKSYCDRGYDNYCPRTCEKCSDPTASYVDLPSGIPQGRGLIGEPNIFARFSESDMQSKCSLCTTKTCPSIPICVKVTFERLPDDTVNSVGNSPSMIAIGAYNVGSDGYISVLRKAVSLGQGQETVRTPYSLELNMQCQKMDLYLNGTKGNDNLRIHDFNIYYGTCTDAVVKRDTPGVIEVFVNGKDIENSAMEFGKKLKGISVDKHFEIEKKLSLPNMKEKQDA